MSIGNRTAPVPPEERLQPGGNLPWPLWEMINRLRARLAKTRVNMVKWRYHKKDLTNVNAAGDNPMEPNKMRP